MRITAIQAHVLSTEKIADAEDYENTAGLRFPDDSPIGGGVGRTDERHLCVYPTARSTVLVTVEAENGLVGIGEALYILIGASTGEYVALLYGAVLYGLIGACMGFGTGIGVAVLGRFWKRMSEAMAWTVGFLGVACRLGLVITR